MAQIQRGIGEMYESAMGSRYRLQIGSSSEPISSIRALLQGF